MMSILRRMPPTKADGVDFRRLIRSSAIGLFGLLAACVPAAPTISPTDVRTCGEFSIPIPDETLICIEQANGVLLQTPPNGQRVLALYDGTLTMRGTVYVHHNQQALTVTVMLLEGTAVIGGR